MNEGFSGKVPSKNYSRKRDSSCPYNSELECKLSDKYDWCKNYEHVLCPQYNHIKLYRLKNE